MPGTVQNAAPAAVMPWNLCAAFAHSRAYAGMNNDYADGTDQRSLISFTSKKSWRFQPMVGNAGNYPAANSVRTLMETLRAFYDSVGGPHRAFYFYDVFETVRFGYDATGTSTVGRYTVVFRSTWSQVVTFPAATVQLEIEEVT